jgi:hypothetical protein
MLLLYFTLIRPKPEFAFAAWDSTSISTDTKNLEGNQQKCVDCPYIETVPFRIIISVMMTHFSVQSFITFR